MSKWGSAKRSRTTAAPEEVLRSDVATNTTDMEDAMELWDGDEDGIDDSVLLMASQMVEENRRKEPNSLAVAPAVEKSELAEMSRLLEEDADWNDDDVFSEAADAATASSSRCGAPSVVEKPPKPKASLPDGFAKPRTPPPRPTSKISHDEMKSLKDLLARRESEVKTLNDEKYRRHGEVLYLRGELSKRDAALQKDRAERARAAELRAAEVRQLEESRKAQMEKMETEAAFLRRDLENMADQVKRAKVATVKQESEDDKKKAPRVRNGPIAIDESLLCESSPQSQKAPNSNCAKISSKLSSKHTICASVQTDGSDRRERTRRRRIVRRIRMRRDPQSRNIVILASAVNKRVSIIGAEQESKDVFSAAIMNINAAGDGSATLSAAESIVLTVQSHIENRSSNAQMLVDLMAAASVFLESESVATAPQTEKESMARALISVAAGFSGRKPIFQEVETEAEASGEMPLSGTAASEESDFDRCLAAYFDLVHVAVVASAVTPGGFAAVLSTLTLCLRQGLRQGLRALGVERSLSLASAAGMAAAAFRSVEFAKVICGENVNSGNASCVFLGSLSNALDRFIIACDSNGTDVIGKGVTGSCTPPGVLRVTRAIARLISTSNSSSASSSSSMCDNCMAGVTRSAAVALSTVVRAVVDCKAKGFSVPHISTYPIVRSSVICLHQQIWRGSKPGYFVRAMAASPTVQRNYIWTMRIVSDTLRASVNLHPVEENILSDLSVECIDDSQKMDIT